MTTEEVREDRAVAHEDDVLSAGAAVRGAGRGRRARAPGRRDQRRTCGRGERLFAEGDAGDKLYIIINGKIKLTRAAHDGRENLLSVHGPGEMFGELSLFDPSPRTASATAVTDATLAGLAHDDLRAWLTGRPEVAMHMLQALAQRLRRINDINGRPGLHRRARPGGQGPAGPGRSVRRPAGRRHAGHTTT